MENLELKKQKSELILEKFKHLKDYCTIKFEGLNDDNIYFHPIFELDDKTSIRSQSDIANNNNLLFYASNFVMQGENYINTNIDEEIIDSIITGYFSNKEQLLIVMNTLNKVRIHIDNMKSYSNEYIRNVLIGNSVDIISNDLINEIKSTNNLVSFMKKQEKL